jgi:hypothetical protein
MAGSTPIQVETTTKLDFQEENFCRFCLFLTKLSPKWEEAEFEANILWGLLLAAKVRSEACFQKCQPASSDSGEMKVKA